VVAPEGAILSL